MNTFMNLMNYMIKIVKIASCLMEPDLNIVATLQYHDTPAGGHSRGKVERSFF